MHFDKKSYSSVKFFIDFLIGGKIVKLTIVNLETIRLCRAGNL